MVNVDSRSENRFFVRVFEGGGILASSFGVLALAKLAELGKILKFEFVAAADKPLNPEVVAWALLVMGLGLIVAGVTGVSESGTRAVGSKGSNLVAA